MNRSPKAIRLIVATAVTTAVLAAGCSDTGNKVESSTSTTDAPAAATAPATGTVDPDSIETLDQALEAMAIVAAAESPEAAADIELPRRPKRC